MIYSVDLQQIGKERGLIEGTSYRPKLPATLEVVKAR